VVTLRCFFTHWLHSEFEKDKSNPVDRYLRRTPNLKHERELRGWSQAYLAEMIGSDPKTVSRWERGIVLPSPFFLQQLVKIFDMNAEELGLLPEREQAETSADRTFSDPSLSRVDWGEAPHVEAFYGRKQELAELEHWMNDDRCRLVIVFGLGGVGKTTLVTALANQIKDKFQYIFWRSLQNAPSVKSILEECLLFLSGHQQTNFPADIEELISLLIAHLQKQRSLLILDNFESILQGGYQTGRYQEGYEGYGRLIQRLGEVAHLSRIVLTSREKPRQVAHLEGKTQPVRSMHLLGVEQAEARKILENASLLGTDAAWTRLIHLYAGNPLALKLIAEPIREVFGGSITSFLEGEEVVFGDIYDLLDQQFHRLSVLEQTIMYWLAIEREPVSLQEIQENLLYHAARSESLIGALHSLLRRSMIDRNAQSLFTLQPLVMEYVTGQLIRQILKEIDAETLHLLTAYTLVKGHTKDYIRNSQLRFILAPIVENLLTTFGKTECTIKIERLLSILRTTPSQHTSYAAGNILNLLIQLHVDFRQFDFSHLTIRHAYLQGAALPRVNFTDSHFVASSFTDTFGDVRCVASSPNGELFAIGTVNGEIRLWQATTIAPLLTCSGHTDGIRAITFSPDSQKLISGSDDHTVRLWDLHTGRCLGVLQAHNGSVRSVAYSNDGKIIASAGEDQTVCLWESDTGNCLNTLRGHTHWIRSVAFHPDGCMLASAGNDKTIRIWNCDTGHPLAILSEHTSGIRSVTFSPDGTMLASCGDDETIRLWDTNTYRCFSTIQGHAYPIRSIAISPDSKLLASGGDDQTVRLWDIQTGRCLNVLQGHINRVWSVAFSPMNQTLISGSEDQTVRLWDIKSGQCLRTLKGYTSLVWSVAFSPNTALIASGSDDQCVRLWDIDSGQCISTLQGHVNRVRSIAFSPDGKLLASGSEDQTIRLWDISTAKCIKILRGHTHLIRSVAFSPDGRILVSGSHDQTIRLWDIQTEHCIWTRQNSSLIWSIAFSVDGRFVASSSSDHDIQVWDIQTGHLYSTLQGHVDQIWSVAFSPAGNLLASGSDDHTIKLWDINNGRCLQTLQGHTHWVRSLAFSSDGQLLVSGSHDQIIKLWKIPTGYCLNTLQGHSSWIWSVSLSSDSKLVGSGSNDGTIKLWSVQTGDCVKTLKSERPYEGMNITRVKGLTDPQKATLKLLGAVEDQDQAASR
jgi:WD40 repeat protein/transcriptional regulator with XRE-family HTH domain